MSALVRMRLAGFLRGGRALPPLIAVLIALGIMHGGGASPAAVAYCYSAAVLFPVLAWLTKLLLDTEPDAQRRLARLSVGPAREATAGLLAALVLALVICTVAMVAPWLIGAIDVTRFPGRGTLLGALAHLLAVPPALAVGALSSRAVTRNIRTGVAILAVSIVLAIVLGLHGSVAPWLAPPLMATARAFSKPDELPSAGTLALQTAWALLWGAAAFTAYARLRRARS